MKKQFKKNISRLILMAALVLAFGIPVCAASAEVDEMIARSSTPYAPYNLTIVSGVIQYTGSGQNFGRPAVVVMESSDLDYVSVAIYDTLGQMTCNASQTLGRTGTLTFSPAARYPGQYIRAGFLRTGIEGTYSIRGRFYYNGI